MLKMINAIKILLNINSQNLERAALSTLDEFYKDYRKVPADAWRWPNFTPEEIACKGTGKLLINPDALDMLQALRTAVGVPIVPNSAYRSPEHNAAVGGEKFSRHLLGVAFDIPITDKLTRDRIHAVAKEVGFLGFGDYNTFVHIDTGPERDWDRRKKGD